MPDRAIKARRITAIGTLVVAVLLLAGGLYLARVSAQLTYLKSRNFRIAATMAEVAENRLNNVVSILESQARDEELSPERDIDCFDHLGWHEDHGANGNGKPEEEPPPDGEGGGSGDADAEVHLPRGKTGIKVDHGTGKLQIYHWPRGDDVPRKLHASVDARCLLALIEREEVFDDVVVLDDEHRSVFQTGGSGARIHELSVDATETREGQAAGDTAERVLALPATVSRLQEVEVAGERYAFFRQPVRLELQRRDGEGGALWDDEALWEVVGLVRSGRLLSDAMRIDPAGLVVLISLLLLAVCAWPFFKLSATGRRERIQPREVLWISASLAVACALLAVAAVDVGFNAQRREEVSQELKKTAHEIEAALNDELDKARTQLERVLDGSAGVGPEDGRQEGGDGAEDGSQNGLGNRPEDGPGDGQGRWHECDGDEDETRCLGGVHAGGLFRPELEPDLPELRWDGYPHLGMIFWTDACGNQVAKRVVGSQPTPLISVEGREYFRRARDRDLWHPEPLDGQDFADEEPEQGEAEKRREDGGEAPQRPFFVEPVRSWTTGVQEVVLSMAIGADEPGDEHGTADGARTAQGDDGREDGVEDGPADGGEDGTSEGGGDQASEAGKDDGGDGDSSSDGDAGSLRCRPIAAMSVIGLPSMLRPVLPPGRGFAVLDREGRVVFHSRPERNGLESLVRETEDSPELRGSLFARTERHFAARYRGRKHQMYSTPLSGLPWHLVVFEERDVLQTVNFEAAMAALLLVMVQLLLLAAALVFIRLVGRRGTLRSLWPAPDDVGSYVRMAAVSLLVAAAFGASFAWAPSPRLLLAAGFLLPLTALGLIAAVAAPPGRGRAGQRRAALVVAAAAGGLLLAAEVYEAGGAAGADGAAELPRRGLTDPVVLVHGVVLGVAFAVTRRFVAGRHRSRRSGNAEAGQKIGPAVLFVVVSGLTLTVLSALPAAAFLQGAFRERLDLEARRGQIHLARALLERGRTIEREYGSLPSLPLGRESDEEPALDPLPWILADGRDVHARGYLGARSEDGGAPEGRTRAGTCYAYRLDGALERERSRSAALDCAGIPTGGEDWTEWDSRDVSPASLSAWTLLSLPFPNRHAVEARAVVSDEGPESQGSWTWRIPEDGNVDALELLAASPVDDLDAVVSSRVPAPALPRGASREQAAFLGAAVLSLVLIGAALLFVGRRVFHVDFRVRRPPTLADLTGQRFSRLLVVVPPGAVIGDTFGEAELRVDLAETGTPGGDRNLDRLNEELPSTGLVRVDHLEGVLDDAPSREKGLALFERLVARSAEGLRVVLFAHRDPRAVLADERARLEAAEDERASRRALERWEDLLDRFPERWVSGAEDRDAFDREIEEARPELGAGLRRGAGGGGWSRRQLETVQQECRGSRPLQEIGRRLLRQPELAAVEPDDLMSRIGQEAADHYRALWKALAEDEQNVLAQIASGCLTNRGLDRPLDHLLTWGLLVREPSTFRVMNESFRRFVVGHHDAVALLRWEEEGSVGFWRQVRVPFFAVLVAAGLFLMATQRHLFNLAMAVASASAVALPGLVKLVGWVRTVRNGGD